MIWQYLRNKLNMDDHQEQIEENKREINKIRNHVVDLKKSPRKKVIKKVEKRDERVDELKERIDAFYQWGLKMHEAVEKNRKVIDKLSDLLTDDSLFPDQAQSSKKAGQDFTEEQLFNQRKFEGRQDFPSYSSVNEEKSTISSQVSHSGLEEERPTNADQTANNIRVGKKLWEKATDAQKRIIKKMYDLGYPVSYKELASELGNSVSTIKSHINSLKDKDLKFRITLGPNSTKKYLLDDRLKSYLTHRLND